jgi:hypothetical protein
MQQQQENTSLWFGPEQTSRAYLLIHDFSGSTKEEVFSYVTAFFTLMSPATPTTPVTEQKESGDHH